MSSDDLIIAFYPCIYFCAMSQVAFNLGYINYRKLNDCQKIDKIMKRSDDRKEYYDRLLKFVSVCLYRGLRMVFENPWAEQTYLKANFLKKPDVVDMDRTKRGDCRRKPTAYWFWNCEPTNGNTYEPYLGETKAILNSKPSSIDKCNIWLGGTTFRLIHPVEAERLQTLPDNYTAVLKSDNLRIKAIGNGWTVNVITHIFKDLK